MSTALCLAVSWRLIVLSSHGVSSEQTGEERGERGEAALGSDLITRRE